MADVEKTLVIRVRTEGASDLEAIKSEIQQLTQASLSLNMEEAKSATTKKQLTTTLAFLKSEYRRLSQEQKAVIQTTNLQAREEAKLQAHLGRMEAATNKQVEAETRLLQSRRKNIETAVQFSNAQLSVGNGARNTTGSLGSMAIAGQNLNFVLRDSPYFFKNFQLGVLAIGNNIDPLIQSMIRAKNEAKAMGSTFGRELLGFLKGPGGLIVAVSLLNAAFQAIVFSLSKTKDEAKNTKKELDLLGDAANRLVKIKNPLEGFTFGVKPDDIQQQINVLDNLIKRNSGLRAVDNKGFAGTAVGGGGTTITSVTDQLSEADKKRQEAQKKLLEYFKEQKTQLEAQKQISEELRGLGLIPEEKKESIKKKTEELFKDIKPEVQLVFTDTQKKVFDTLKDNLARQGLRWNATTQAFVLALTFSTPSELLQPDGLIDTSKYEERFSKSNLDAIKDGLESSEKYRDVFVSSIGESLRNTFSKAWADIFGEANSFLGQLISNLASSLLELSTSNILSDLFSLLIPGGSILSSLGILHDGGIVKAHEGMLASDEIPIIARKGEMIFNDRQQGNLFNLINNPPTNRGGGDGGAINITMPVILDGDVIAQKQYKYLPGHLQRLSREGMLN